MNERKLSVAVIILVFMSAFHVAITILPQSASAATLYVGGSGFGNYTTIRNAVDDANPGDVVYVYNGTYSEDFTISESISLVGEDKNTTIIRGDDVSDTILIMADQATVKGFTIMGGGTATYDAGIDLQFAENCHITDNIFLWTNRSGVYLYQSQNNVVEHNVFTFSGFAGIRLRYSDNNEISNNTITNDLHGMFLGFSARNTIWGNTIAVDTGTGIETRWASESNIIAFNTISAGGKGIELYDSNSTYISNNTITGGAYGIDIFDSEGVQLTGNEITSSTIGISLVHTTYSSLTLNQMFGCGIVIVGQELEYWTTHSIETSNRVNGKPVRYWTGSPPVWIPWSGVGQIILADCDGCRVEGFEITNTSVAVQVGFSSNVYILNNTFSGNKEHGIAAESIKYSYINDNTIANNGRYGIIVWRSDENKIARNHLVENEVLGMGVYGGEYNLIFHNDFMGEDYWQAENEGATNSWDLGYPLGGNYWSDYIYNDTFGGENQDKPGRDGIGDNQHNFNLHINDQAKGTDRYPLMSPFVTPPPQIGSPECQIVSPAQDETVEGVVEMSGTASDPDGTVEKVEFRIDDSPWIAVEGTMTWTYELDTEGYPNGEHHIFVRSFDGEKYSAEVNRTVFIENPEPDNLGQILLWALLAIVIVISIIYAYMYISRYREYRKEKRLEEEEFRVKVKK